MSDKNGCQSVLAGKVSHTFSFAMHHERCRFPHMSVLYTELEEHLGEEHGEEEYHTVLQEFLQSLW